MSGLRMQARYPGVCCDCDGAIRPGDAITYLPPKGKRRRGLTRCDNCRTARIAPPGSHRGRTNVVWRGNREWMTAQSYAVLEEAMAKMSPHPDFISAAAARRARGGAA